MSKNFAQQFSFRFTAGASSTVQHY